MSRREDAAIEHYLRTGETDPLYAAWDGEFLERSQRATQVLRRAVVAEVARRAAGRSPRALPPHDAVALTRAKITPMVQGLFPAVEREPLLTFLEKSVIFVTAENIASLITGHAWDRSAWDLANLFLGSIGAPRLAASVPAILGFNEHLTCYLSAVYFDEQDGFADYLVHEIAHVFHHCKRGTVGLREPRRAPWLLAIDYGKREEFAYSCEAYARILVRARRPADRRRLAEEFAREAGFAAASVETAAVVAHVRAAVAGRNGWKIILARCAPPARSRRRSPVSVG